MDNPKTDNERRNEEEEDKGIKMDPSKIIGHIYIKEEIIIPDDPVEDNYMYENAQEPEEGDGCEPYMKEDNMTNLAEEAQTSEDVLLAAWWNYKRMTKHRRKRRKILRIYRDENYWTSDRFTDTEDFNYYSDS